MGKVTTFEILVDNPGGVVKAGDTLRGQILLEFSEDLEVNEIRVNFTGRAHVQWVEAQKATPMLEVQTAMDPMVADEVYISDVLKLFPSGPQRSGSPARGNVSTRLSRGSHLYEFQFPVPCTAPSTFGGNCGYIRYTLKAVLERTWKVDCNTRHIVVLSELDLNNVPEARESVELCDDLKIHSLFFPSGNCHAIIRLARKGIVAGEVIPAEFSIHNCSHQAIRRVSLHLKKVVSYKAANRLCVVEFPIAKSSLGKVPARQTLEGLDRTLLVPASSQPSGMPGCGIISVTYKLELKVKPALLSLKWLKVSTDVIVGTSPLTLFDDSPPDYWSCYLPSYEDVLASPSLITPTQPMTSPKATSEVTGHTVTAGPPAAEAAEPPPATLQHKDQPRLTVLRQPPATLHHNDQPRLTVLRQPPATCQHHDQPRLTVLRQPPATLTQDSGLQRWHPLLRPRANTGPVPGLARSRGR